MELSLSGETPKPVSAAAQPEESSKQETTDVSSAKTEQPISPPLQPTSSATTSSKVLASPAVRAYGHEKNVDLSGLVGSGRGGRITRQDIDLANQPTTPSRPPAIQVARPAAGQDEVVKIIGLRRKIAEKMVESVQRAPHFTYVDEVDATELVAIRKKLKPIAESQGVKLTYLPFIMKALVTVFRDFPTVNANMDEEAFAMIVRGEVNIGIATDTPQGLYVPVIKNVEQKSILELAAEAADLSQRTREGKVQLSELQGGTFTITSVEILRTFRQS